MSNNKITLAEESKKRPIVSNKTRFLSTLQLTLDNFEKRY